MCIRDSAKGRGVERLPLAGRIAAGYPVETSEIPESISLGDIIGNRDVFALQVRGESCLLYTSTPKQAIRNPAVTSKRIRRPGSRFRKRVAASITRASARRTVSAVCGLSAFSAIHDPQFRCSELHSHDLLIRGHGFVAHG